MSPSSENPFRRKPKAPVTDNEAAQEQPAAETPAATGAESSRDHERFSPGLQDDAGGVDRRKGPRKKAPEPDTGRFGVRRGGPGQGLRRLPDAMQELAEGTVERLRRPPRSRDPVEDERVGFLFPGVRNLDARAVYDARVVQLRAAVTHHDDDALAAGLCDVMRLSLFRARNVTDFEAFADSVVGVDGKRARALAEAGAVRAGSTLTPVPMHVAALWLRTEASMLRDCPDGRVSVRGPSAELRLVFDFPATDVNRVAIALFDMGGAANGLRPFLREDAAAPAPAAAPAEAERPRSQPRDQDTRSPRGRDSFGGPPRGERKPGGFRRDEGNRRGPQRGRDDQRFPPSRGPQRGRDDDRSGPSSAPQRGRDDQRFPPSRGPQRGRDDQRKPPSRGGGWGKPPRKPTRG